MKKNLIAASFGLALFLPQAEAALFNFSYAYNGNILEGIVDGTLEGDNNIVAVNSIQTLTFNGEARPSLPLVHNADYLYSVVLYPDIFPLQPGFPVETTPWLSLDGSYMNLVFCQLGDCDNGVNFNAGNSLATLFSGPFIAAGSSYGFTHSDYVQADWHMSAVPVPEPETYAMLLGGLGLLGFMTRRRKESIV
ncbi:MAG: PEP-CTERM sorting domain-containing protein [Nitrosomonas sp.]|nr:PEP-CTERM sorting domain-containing protein [Nitrosomonas sp.]